MESFCAQWLGRRGVLGEGDGGDSKIYFYRSSQPSAFIFGDHYCRRVRPLVCVPWPLCLFSVVPLCFFVCFSAVVYVVRTAVSAFSDEAVCLMIF